MYAYALAPRGLNRSSCWLVVKLGTPKTKRLDKSDERSKKEVRERKGRGEMSTLIPSFPTPHFYLGSLNFYWLKSNKTCFFLIFLFDRSSSFRNDFACSNAPNRSVNRYDALKLFLCFGSSCHGVFIGQARHPVPLVTLLHTLLSLCFGSSRHNKCEAKLHQY
jgi:hypothetical protein